ncbi:MAG: hypothetical protein ABIQ30_04050 [Devosia sp.]
MTDEPDGPAMMTLTEAHERFGTILFVQLTQPMRAWAIVGCYVGYFALLETTIARTLAQLLDLDSLAGAIVARNMGMVEKIQAVRTIVNIGIHRVEEKARIDDLLKRAKKAAEERNIVAHVPFGESTVSNGVEFHTVDARGTFRSSVMDWSIAISNGKIDELRAIDDALSSAQSKESLAAAMRAIKGSPRTLEDWLKELGLGAVAASNPTT